MQLYFKKYGTLGQPIVILHGLFGMGDNWHTIAQNLSDQFIVYVVDQRNHGKSFHSDIMNYEAMAKDVFNMMASEGLENTILLGHSMGGKIAMKCASMFAPEISKLIVVDIAPKQYNASHQIYFDAMKSINYKAETRKEIELSLAKTIKNEAERLFVLKNLYRDENGDFNLRLNLQSIEGNYSEILSAIEFANNLSVPTLFIKGSRSDYITLEDQFRIRKDFQNVDFEEVEDAGHWVHAENPTGFLKCLLPFIKN